MRLLLFAPALKADLDQPYEVRFDRAGNVSLLQAKPRGAPGGPEKRNHYHVRRHRRTWRWTGWRPAALPHQLNQTNVNSAMRQRR
jgi:hypothetical protein